MHHILIVVNHSKKKTKQLQRNPRTVDIQCFAIIVLQWAIPYLYTFASNLFSIIINMLIEQKFVQTTFLRNTKNHSLMI